MIQNLNARLFIIFAVFVVALIWAVPNFVNLENKWWFTKDKMVMGLDIQGGSHLVLRVDVDSVVKQDTTRLADTLMREMAEEKVPVKAVTVTDPLAGGLSIQLANPADKSAVQGFLDKFYGQQLQVTSATDAAVNVQFMELYLREFKSRLLDQAIETIRNRIDEFGVSEPSITAQGTDRILVQLPGIKDASNAKDLINRTARLDFMIVDQTVPREKLEELIAEAEKTAGLKMAEMKYSEYVDKLNEALKGKLPEKTLLFFEKAENAATMEAGRFPYLLKTDEMVGGDRLTNAFVGMGDFNQPVVNFAFDGTGARQFGDLTRKHEKQQMAIVLDKVVKSAPVIDEPITQGKGIIRLGGGRDPNQSLNEAKLISMALRAGALPATLEQLEERTVGPSLGADAIQQGQKAALVGAAIVFLFMIFYYKSFGFIADLSLVFNVLIVIAVLSSLNATLTLPGIAGLALTIGIAVDSNVIIYERIREELRKGATLMAAIREGYDRAFSAIADANVTSVAVCIILMYYGTGPVRGFAVTLMSGLIIQMFTGVFFTRVLLDLFVGRLKWKLKVA